MIKVLEYIKNQHDIIYKVFLFLLTTISIVYFFPKEASFKYDFQKNKPWFYEDLIAPYDIPVYPTEQEIENKKKEINANKSLYFNIDKNVTEKQITQFQSNVNQSFDEFFKRYKAKNSSIFKKENPKSVKQELLKKGEKLINRVYDQGVIEFLSAQDSNQTKNIFYVKKDKYFATYTFDDVFSVKQAYEFILNELDEQSLEGNYLLKQLEGLFNNNAFNIVLDREATNQAFEKEVKKASNALETVIKGQSIIKRGDIVDVYKYRVLKSYEKKFKDEHLSWNKKLIITIGQVLLVSLIIFCLALYLIFFRERLISDNKSLVFILLTIAANVIFCSLILHYNLFSVYVFPLCLVPLVIRSFFDTRTAFFCHLIVILLLGFIIPNGFDFMFMQLIAGMVGIYGFVNFKNRSQLFYTTFAILFAYFISHCALSIITEGDFTKIDWGVFGSFAIAAGLTLLTYPIIYVLEKMFGFVSDVTLLELADTNNKLLRELSRVAPGTFQHSLQVANLAEEAIYKIGGNALLIRTAALYHDIGKMKAPMYYIENQSTGVNPHDELSYEESAQIIIDHVIHGIEIAKKHGLPESVIDFIRTHHGTTTTGYFYKMYQEENPDEEDIKSKFQYPGPIPFDKETAVLMMSDSVEAASRSLKAPNAENIDKLVEGIISHQMDERQFSNADITLKDITEIKKIFKKMLMNIYHVRIEYPK